LTLSSASDSGVFLRHCTRYKFTYLLTYLSVTAIHSTDYCMLLPINQPHLPLQTAAHTAFNMFVHF